MISEKYKLFGIVVTANGDYLQIDEEYDDKYVALNRYSSLKAEYINIQNIMVYKTEVKLITYEFSRGIV